MRIVIQRVASAFVCVEEQIIGQIKKGYVIFLGISNEDNKELVEKYVDKIIKMRIFEDENGKTNLSLGDVKGELLVVSQFTLYADCKKGNRPNFLLAAPPKMAEELYDYFVERCREKLGKVACGSFGAEMKVELVNDGPFTIVLDSNQ